MQEAIVALIGTTRKYSANIVLYTKRVYCLTSVCVQNLKRFQKSVQAYGSMRIEV